MPALHIMTLNLQLLPAGASILQGQSTDDDKGRANRIANDILSEPPDKSPDVLVFNEVFDEDSRKILINRLRSSWLHFIPKLDDGGLTEDSGLMLFSRFPLLPLGTGGNLMKRFFGAYDGDDAYASKGVGIIQIGVPAKPTTIAFTHLQASYQTEDEYRDIRVKQLDDIYAALDQLFAGDAGQWARTIILGDLNIRGDSGAKSGEWAHVFEKGGTKLCGPMIDGWRAYMHPPDKDIDIDRGFTHLDFETRESQRLDYQCFVNREAVDRALVPHHIFTHLRNSSDHFALSAIVQEFSPRCVPVDAIDFLSMSALAGKSPNLPSSVRFADVQFQHEGSFQWLYVRNPGTYSIGASKDTTFNVYSENNLSDPLSRLDTLNVQDLPLDLQNAFRQLNFTSESETFVSRTPFFIATRQVKGQIGSGRVVLMEHHGESQATAIGLRVHDEVASSFPIGQLLGEEDKCWFKALMPTTFTGAPRSEHFRVSNQLAAEITITLMDATSSLPGSTIAIAAGTQNKLQTVFEAKGLEIIFLNIARKKDTENGFMVRWDSPISYLLLDEPIGLYVDDESGVDRLGEDEPELILTIDDDAYQVFSGNWDDADTGERWPDLDKAIRQGIQYRFPGVTRCGFVTGISLTYVEPDMNAQGWLSATIESLTRSEPHTAVRQISMPVPDLVSDGHYTFYCTITRLPN